jgi:hypothetical protein
VPEGFGLLKFEGAGLKESFGSEVGLLPLSSKVVLTTSITGAGMGGAFDAVLAAVAHLDGTETFAEHRFQLHPRLHLPRGLAAQENDAFLHPVNQCL